MMAVEPNISHTLDSASSDSFKDSQEAAFRRVVRQEIRRGPFSKSEREVAIAFFNHWFQHRRSQKGCVHPGRKKLARRAQVTIKTVSRTLDLLRRSGAIFAVDHLGGLRGNATEYTVSIPHLFELCARKKADLAVYGGTNVSTSGRDKMSLRNNNVLPFLNQKREA